MDEFPIVDRLGSTPSVRDRGRDTLQQRKQLPNRRPSPPGDETPDENAESGEELKQHQLDELV